MVAGRLRRGIGSGRLTPMVHSVTPLRTAFAVLFAVPLLAACSGRDALQAEQLLQQAQQAQQSLSSETLSAHVVVQAKGQQVSIALTGGGYMKGEHAGDFSMSMTLSAPVALPFSSMQVAHVGSSTWMDVGGKRVSLPSSSTGTGATGSGNLLQSFDLTRYVKDVTVDGGEVLNGKPVTKITGVLDTAALLQGLSSFGSAMSSTGLPDLGGHVSDTRVVIYIDDATHVLTAALADFSVKADGEEARMHLDVAVTGINQPVDLPTA